MTPGLPRAGPGSGAGRPSRPRGELGQRLGVAGARDAITAQERETDRIKSYQDRQIDERHVANDRLGHLTGSGIGREVDKQKDHAGGENADS